MTSDRWLRVQDIFAEAADLPSVERALFLDRQCAGDRDLRAEVDSLFAYDTREQRPLEAVVGCVAASLLAAESMIGKRIGAYRLERHLGTGGMGTVYLAVRDDAQFDQKVAIKVVRDGLNSRSVVERFRYERRILAQLDHPYIAKLLDGGTSPEGLPYFVMEYVEGTPIHRYCAAHRFSVAEKCTLFTKVCEAVSYAHRNLVIHRDLKPSNIMVSEDGTPKLLDFGIAKLLSPDTTDAPLTRTGMAPLPMTPDYASPEQVMGGPFNTTTDVYSLGTVLYELLTGARPHHIAQLTPLALERAICVDEARRASLVAPAELRRELAGDLDTILAMALRKEPQRRYQSAADFREDLLRYLKGLPVAARDDTLFYRTRKFVRRHHVGVFATAVILVALAGGVISTDHERKVAEAEKRAALAQRATADRERARAQSAQAEASSQRDAAFAARQRAEAESQEAGVQRARAQERLEEILGIADKTLLSIEESLEKVPGATEARKTMVQETIAYLDRVAVNAGDDLNTIHILLDAYTAMGDVQGYPYRPNLGDYAGALASYRKAESFLGKLQQRMPNNSDILEAAVGVYQRIGETMGEMGNRTDALPYLHKAMAAAERAHSMHPDVRHTTIQVALMHHSLAIFLMKTDVPAGASHAQAEQAMYSKLVEQDPKDIDTVNSLASSYLMMSQAVAYQGNLQESVEYIRKAAKVREDLTAQFPDNVVLARNLLVTYGRLADALGGPYLAKNLGDSAQAIVYYRKTLAIAERLAVADPNDRLARNDLATVLMRLGMALERPDQINESVGSLRRSEELLKPLIAADPASPRERRSLSMVYEYLGHRLEAQGRPDDALAMYWASAGHCEVLLAKPPPSATEQAQLMADHQALALLLASMGHRAEALQSAEKSVALAEALAAGRSGSRFAPASYEAAGQAYATLARSGGGSADWGRAREWFAKSRDAWKKLQEPAGDVARVESRLAECERELAR